MKMKPCMWPQINQIVSNFIRLGIILLLPTTLFAYIFTDKSDIIFGANNYGRMVPGHFISLPIGQYLELFCSINAEKAKTLKYSVENLVLFKEDRIIERSHITRINETTIRLYMENIQESVDVYYCYLQKNLSAELPLILASNNSFVRDSKIPPNDTIPNSILVGVTSVHVGPKPGEVENVICISLNWQKLNCSWYAPQNDAPTYYSIAYSPMHRFWERTQCPTDSDNEKSFCLWTLWSMPGYRKNLATLNITITGRNQFGSIEQDLLFHQYENILLDPPKGLVSLARKSTSITLQWDIGQLQYFPEPIDYKIQYLSSPGKYWHTIWYRGKDVVRDKQHVSYTISDLAKNTPYQFRVFMKSSVASDEYWSFATPSATFSTI